MAIKACPSVESSTYDWLGRKTAMTDPDMGYWSYVYDNNGNLTGQTDAKGQTVSMGYDALNRLIGKSGTGLAVSYIYDDTSDGNYGKGKRTGMIDALATSSYRYDKRGRLIRENRLIQESPPPADPVNFTTLFTYDGADRVVTTTYPTNEVVSSGYTGRGLPYSVSGSVAGSLVSSVLYNNLSLPTEINLGNGLKSNFGYWGYSGTYDNSGGYYGRLYRIRTALGQNNPLQNVTHTWDAGGNLTQRQSLVTPGQPPTETESFSYDFLDRLTGASGPYTESYAYNTIGGIASKNGVSYTYDFYYGVSPVLPPPIDTAATVA